MIKRQSRLVPTCWALLAVLFIASVYMNVVDRLLIIPRDKRPDDSGPVLAKVAALQDQRHEQLREPRKAETNGNVNEPNTLSEEEAYFALDPAERFKKFKQMIKAYANQRITCDTNFIHHTLWCDGAPGNGFNFFLRTAAMGFILNRLPLIAVHRKASCERFIRFKREELFEHNSGPSTYFNFGRRSTFHNCPRGLEVFKFNEIEPRFKCNRLAERPERVLLYESVVDTNFGRFSEFLDSEVLPPDAKLRARMISDIGMLTATGLLFDEFMEISADIIKQLDGDYRYPANVLNELKDPSVLKVSLHVRHLPHVYWDANGPQLTDKRASRCLDAAIKMHAANYTKGCLLLLATDMEPERPDLIRRLNGSDIMKQTNCRVHFLQRVGNVSSTSWGGPTISKWEKRASVNKDPRSVLEAYLDMVMLSQHSQIIVTTSGSSYSTLVAMLGFRREDPPENFVFPEGSCKEDGVLSEKYQFYLCCLRNRRFNEMVVSLRSLSRECDEYTTP